MSFTINCCSDILTGPLTAISKGHIECFFNKHHCESRKTNPVFAHFAAAHGHLDILQKLHAEGYSWDHLTPAAAVAGDHQSCLEYALTNSCPISEFAIRTAAAENRSSMIKYICEFTGNKKLLTPFACTVAAKHGNLEALVTLHELGCDWDENCTKAAATGNHTDCLEYAIQAGCPHHQI